jgi:hypothetical protein
MAVARAAGARGTCRVFARAPIARPDQSRARALVTDRPESAVVGVSEDPGFGATELVARRSGASPCRENDDGRQGRRMGIRPSSLAARLTTSDGPRASTGRSLSSRLAERANRAPPEGKNGTPRIANENVDPAARGADFGRLCHDARQRPSGLGTEVFALRLPLRDGVLRHGVHELVEPAS